MRLLTQLIFSHARPAPGHPLSPFAFYTCFFPYLYLVLTARTTDPMLPSYFQLLLDHIV